MNEQTVALPDSGYYSTLKRNELLSHKTTWRTLKHILQVKGANLKRLCAS